MDSELTKKVTIDDIMSWVKEQVESKRMLNPDMWIEIAFRLNVLLGDEHYKLENARQDVAKMKLDILQKQEKRNVAAADLEIEASDEYRLMKLQEHLVDRVEEFIKIAKKNSSKF